MVAYPAHMDEPRSSLRQRHRERTAADIEAAAFALFVERGVDAVTVEAIAGAAGISPRTFYRSFPTKEDVVFGDHAATLARLRAALAAGDPAEAPLRRVRRALLAVQSPAAQPEREWTRARLIATSPAIRPHAARLVEDLEEAVVATLTAAFAPAPDAATRAHLLAGALFGALRGARRAVAADPTADPVAVIEAVFALVEEGATLTLLHPATSG